MTVTLHSTSLIVTANGVNCRVWEGRTASGIPVQALIPRIAAHGNENLAEFERELEEQAEPSPDAVICFPLRMVL